MGHSRHSMGIHSVDSKLVIRRKTQEDIVVALAGNPNVGKSTVFNALTGLRQHTGNWPGKTVSSTQGYCTYKGQGFVFVDIPGCYSLSAHSREEEVAGDFIRSGKADVVAVVCDATCLERNMILALQILSLTRRVIICVNLMDEAEKKHISIHLKKLEERLGVPVVPVSARNSTGMDDILKAVSHTAKVQQQTPLRELEASSGERVRAAKKSEYYVDKAELICRDLICYEDKLYAEGDRKKDKIFTGRLTAFPIMILLLIFLFWLTIVGANVVSEALQTLLLGAEEKLYGLCTYIDLPVLLKEMLIHGMLRVVIWVVAVMLPPMAIFFPLFALLEDSGYLPRVAFNLDKCFHRCHACGKQALTMCMGIVNL